MIIDKRIWLNIWDNYLLEENVRGKQLILGEKVEKWQKYYRMAKVS